MKTHKIRFAGWDSYLDVPDGSFRTYCGITETCNEDLAEKGIVGEHEECTCLICQKAYRAAMRKVDEALRKIEIQEAAIKEFQSRREMKKKALW